MARELEHWVLRWHTSMTEGQHEKLHLYPNDAVQRAIDKVMELQEEPEYDVKLINTNRHELTFHCQLNSAFSDPRYCRECGCSEYDPCPSGCSWVEDDLCSVCAGEEGDEDGG